MPLFYNLGFGGYEHPGFREAQLKALDAVGLKMKEADKLREILQSAVDRVELAVYL